VAKELGRRWATLDVNTKHSYEQRYQDSRKDYESALVTILRISFVRKIFGIF
jgi:hypothetical protein